MLDKEKIRRQEENNDGQSVFLYYDGMIGLYLAYGLSAYYTTLVTNPFVSYSVEMEMPVALLKREHILYLRQSLTMVDHVLKQFYVFKLKARVGDAGYARWADHKKNKD